MLTNTVIGAVVKPASNLVNAALSSTKPEQSFASVLGQVMQDTASSLRSSEALSARGLQGEANVQEVVAGVLEAERNLQAAIVIRDKLVSAYNEIMRMQI